MKRALRQVLRLALVGALTVIACRDGVGPKRAVPGDLYVRLETPNATDAAIRVTLSGPGIGALAPVGDRLLYSLPGEAGSQRIAVFGVLTTGDILSFAVPDVDHPERYTVTVVQVATATNALRVLLTGYIVSIHD